MIRVMALVGPMLLCGAALAEDKLTLNDLEGTWVMVGLTRGGDTVPPALVKRLNVRLKIEGDKFSVTAGEVSDPAEHGTLKLDADVTPNKLDQHLAGEAKGKVENGIAQLKDGKLVWCEAEVGDPHPKEFASPKGRTDSLAEFERVKD